MSTIRDSSSKNIADGTSTVQTSRLLYSELGLGNTLSFLVVRLSSVQLEFVATSAVPAAIIVNLLAPQVADDGTTQTITVRTRELVVPNGTVVRIKVRQDRRVQHQQTVSTAALWEIQNAGGPVRFTAITNVSTSSF